MARNVPARKPPPLQKRHRGGPPSHAASRRSAATTLRVAKRQRQAYDLFMGEGRGLTFREIGAKLGVSGKTAHGDVTAYLEAARQSELFGNAEVMRARQAATVDEVIRAQWKSRKKTRSAEVILSALQREAKLLGLDLQRKDTYTVEQVVGAFLSIARAFNDLVADPEIRRQFAIRVKRISGPGFAGAAIAEPGPVVAEQERKP